MKNHAATMTKYENKPGSMKNQPGIMKIQAETMKNHEN